MSVDQQAKIAAVLFGFSAATSGFPCPRSDLEKCWEQYVQEIWLLEGVGGVDSVPPSFP